MSRNPEARFQRRDPGAGAVLSIQPGKNAGTSGAPRLVAHFFRHEYGRLVARLTRRAGSRHLEIVEDAVQSAMMTALAAWTAHGLPDDPGAWLYRVAWNRLVGDLRSRDSRVRLLERFTTGVGGGSDDPATPFFAGEVQDDLLRMLFVCCDEAIPRDSRLVLALKTLCGFSVTEIALRLFTTEASVYKRLARAREKLRQAPLQTQTPPLDSLRTRLPSVHEVLYLLFNEGYLSSREEEAIRRELCAEAIRLATLLAEHTVAAVPATFALLALMHLQAARLATRLDGAGGLLLLEEQDRSLWDREHMRMGAEWLERSARGDEFSRFHAEAGIAAEHCFAPTFEQTRWKEIADLYAMLERIAPSPLHTLNRAVALAQWLGPEAGLALLQGLVLPAWLAGSHLWDAVLGDLHRRAGNSEAAVQHRERALALAPTAAVRALLRQRLAPRGSTDEGAARGLR
jgi:RNA polymerase sigma-70 factor (ECF subfamily)